MIAGHVEAGESATHAMVREAREETGITLRPEDLVLTHVIHRFENQERVDLFFKADRWVGEPKVMEDKASEIRWFRLSELPKQIVPYVMQAIVLGLRAGRIYSEYGWVTEGRDGLT